MKYSKGNSDVFVRARAEGTGIALEVEDHGIGIPSQEVDRIFERFYRSTAAGDGRPAPRASACPSSGTWPPTKEARSTWHGGGLGVGVHAVASRPERSRRLGLRGGMTGMAGDATSVLIVGDVDALVGLKTCDLLELVLHHAGGFSPVTP